VSVPNAIGWLRKSSSISQSVTRCFAQFFPMFPSSQSQPSHEVGSRLATANVYRTSIPPVKRSGRCAEVYGGQIIGENSRDADMVVQVCRKKHLTNMRGSGSDIAVHLTPPKIMTFEQCLEWIEDDQGEVTPKSIRIRNGA